MINTNEELFDVYHHNNPSTDSGYGADRDVGNSFLSNHIVNNNYSSYLDESTNLLNNNAGVLYGGIPIDHSAMKDRIREYAAIFEEYKEKLPHRNDQIRYFAGKIISKYGNTASHATANRIAYEYNNLANIIDVKINDINSIINRVKNSTDVRFEISRRDYSSFNYLLNNEKTRASKAYNITETQINNAYYLDCKRLDAINLCIANKRLINNIIAASHRSFNYHNLTDSLRAHNEIESSLRDSKRPKLEYINEILPKLQSAYEKLRKDLYLFNPELVVSDFPTTYTNRNSLSQRQLVALNNRANVNQHFFAQGNNNLANSNGRNSTNMYVPRLN